LRKKGDRGAGRPDPRGVSPRLCRQGLAAEKTAGIDIPLRIHLYEAGGHTWVAYRPAIDVFKPYVNPQLDVLGGELDAIFNQLLATLDPWKLP